MLDFILCSHVERLTNTETGMCIANLLDDAEIPEKAAKHHLLRVKLDVCVICRRDG